MKKVLRWMVALLVVGGVAGLLIWLFAQGQVERAAERRRDRRLRGGQGGAQCILGGGGGRAGGGG